MSPSRAGLSQGSSWTIFSSARLMTFSIQLRNLLLIDVQGVPSISTQFRFQFLIFLIVLSKKIFCSLPHHSKCTFQSKYAFETFLYFCKSWKHKNQWSKKEMFKVMWKFLQSTSENSKIQFPMNIYISIIMN